MKKEDIKNNAVTKKAGSIFAKIQKKTGIDNKKIDAFQKSWLAMPKTRKKYEHLEDAPEVVGEEAIAMANDIIDFMQGEETGQSHVFKKIKAEVKEIAKDPKGFAKGLWEKGKKKAEEIEKNPHVKSLMSKAKGGLDKAKDAAMKNKAIAEGMKTVNEAKKTAEKIAKKK